MALTPAARDYFIFAHRSAEAGFSKISEKLHFDPLLNLHMRLGEGTGAALAMQLVDHAVRLFREMPTFEEAEVSRQVP
jgi:nicotinate-nucleotide--dimethylbenzimidazole phosphoribosyltransferase